MTHNTPDSLNLVAEFHQLFKHPIVDKPAIPDKGRCKLRIALLQEELKELEQAIEQKDLIEVADALCDLQYVLAGAILEFGMGEKFKEMFKEVHRSNMSKACTTEEEAVWTMDYFKKEYGTECYTCKEGDKWLVYRTQDHKVMKSIAYSKASLKQILDR